MCHFIGFVGHAHRQIIWFSHSLTDQNANGLSLSLFLSLSLPRPAVIKKTELTKKAEAQTRSPARKIVLKAAIPRQARPASTKRKPTGDLPPPRQDACQTWLPNTSITILAIRHKASILFFFPTYFICHHHISVFAFNWIIKKKNFRTFSFGLILFVL